MAYDTTALKYGWAVLTAIAVGMGATIYVVNNQRKQVKAEDVIELYLGAYERCLATQYTTNNPPDYYVAPTNLIRTWTSNVYTTNGVTVYTNIVTNTIGWHTDRTYMTLLDTKIKALIPYYVDPDTFQPLTVTGLWASLEIGDKTNKFTRAPAIGANAATYGDYPWQIYEADLVERYKVLNALIVPKPEYSANVSFTNITKYGAGYAEAHWVVNGYTPYEKRRECKDGGDIEDVAKSRADDAYDASAIVTNNSVNPIATSRYGGFGGGWAEDNGHWCEVCTENTGGYTNWEDANDHWGSDLFLYATSDTYLSRGARRATYQVNLINSNALPFLDSFVVKVVTEIPVSYGVYDSQGDFAIQGTNIVESNPIAALTNTFVIDIGDYSLTRPTWEGSWGGGYGVSEIQTTLTFKSNITANANFFYCTNKYW